MCSPLSEVFASLFLKVLESAPNKFIISILFSFLSFILFVLLSCFLSKSIYLFFNFLFRFYLFFSFQFSFVFLIYSLSVFPFFLFLSFFLSFFKPNCFLTFSLLFLSVYLSILSCSLFCTELQLASYFSTSLRQSRTLSQPVCFLSPSHSPLVPQIKFNSLISRSNNCVKLGTYLQSQFTSFERRNEPHRCRDKVSARNGLTQIKSAVSGRSASRYFPHRPTHPWLSILTSCFRFWQF